MICLSSLAFVHHHRICCTGSTLTFEFSTKHPGLTFVYCLNCEQLFSGICHASQRQSWHSQSGAKQGSTSSKHTKNVKRRGKTNRFLIIYKAAHRSLWEWYHGKVQITSLTSFTWLLLEIPRSCPDMKRITAMTTRKRTKKFEKMELKGCILQNATNLNEISKSLHL